MAARSTWKGFIRLSLVSIPVRAYTASRTGRGIALNQLHAECHSRIRYQKTCPVHGEVSADEIVMGYEYSKGQYVEIDPDELEKLRSESDRAINIENFIRPEEIDPMYFTEKTSYLAPDGKAGHKSFALLQQAMAEDNLFAVAQVVLHGKEQLVLVRPMEGLFAMTTLQYGSDVKPASSLKDEVVSAHASAEETKLVKMLIDATKKPFDIDEYHDLYTKRLTKLIESKVEGKEIVAPESDEHPQVINLMEALRKSVAEVQGIKLPSAARKAAKKTARKKMAPSARQRKPAKRKKKTG